MKTEKEIEMYDEGLIDGHDTLESRIKKLLFRREDLDKTFNWRLDLIQALVASDLEIHKLENHKWNEKSAGGDDGL